MTQSRGNFVLHTTRKNQFKMSSRQLLKWSKSIFFWTEITIVSILKARKIWSHKKITLYIGPLLNLDILFQDDGPKKVTLRLFSVQKSQDYRCYPQTWKLQNVPKMKIVKSPSKLLSLCSRENREEAYGIYLRDIFLGGTLRGLVHSAVAGQGHEQEGGEEDHGPPL